MKLILSCKDIIYVVNQKEILYCQSDNSYTTVFLISGEKLIASRSLKFISEKLDQNFFLKVNQSYLVNKEFISRINRRDKVVELINLDRIKYTLTVKELLDSFDYKIVLAEAIEF
jgi:DNA-binding LytR/AlgR family response regulator